MQTPYEIFEYLPLQYKDQSDLEYFQFLTHSVEQNYNAGNFHFALVALHMIYMGIVYHYIYAIFRADPKKFDLVLIGFHDFLESKKIKDFSNLSWHNFSIINEAHIFQFYRAIGLNKGDVKTLKNPVNNRNDLLHTNGSFLADENRFDELAQQYLQNLQKIHNACQPKYEKLYNKFLRSIKIKPTKEEAEEFLAQDFIKEYGTNQQVIKDLSKKPKSSYIANTKIFFQVLKDKC